MTASGKNDMPWNFLGLPDELTQPDRAQVWVLPIPYEATTSYGKGARNGPDAIIDASRRVEWYDHRRGCEPCTDFGVRTLSPLDPADYPPDAMIDPIAKCVEGILSGSPAPQLLAILGGEHSISGGIVRGIVDAANLVAVHIDAHADLRDEYGGTPHSHACAARRIAEVCPIFQLGIRNISEQGDAFRRQSGNVHTVFADEMTPGGKWLEDLAAFVRGKTVYLTIDADGLDPSIMPAVGTPEPGGLSWQTTLDVVRTVTREATSIPVFDLVELAPIPGLIAPDFLCAKLVYQIMCMALGKE